jgi:hypothetical protein
MVACGGDDETNSETAATDPATVASGACEPIEEVDIGPVVHDDREFTSADYDTIPPAGGDHNDPATAGSRVYTAPPPLGETVHFLEHGAVVGWTNGLSPEDQQAVEDAFNDLIAEGYYQVAVVENPDLEGTFALSAWGALQRCSEVDAVAIRAFAEEWYASPKTPEGGLACQGDARTLPNC